MSRARNPVLCLAAPLATVVGVAGLLRLLYDPWYLNYDARYSLLWAHDLWHGLKPDYAAEFAPTPHPLQTAVSSLALPFGNSADQVLTWIVLLSFGALVWLVYRLGAELFSPWVGVVTALVVLTRPALERDTLLAYQDVPFAALVVGAVLLEARRPRRGLPVLAVLAFAGLLRPEAWVLSGLYVLYLWRDRSTRDRILLCAVAAIAPVLWAVSDLIITGDLLHSLHGTSALAEEQNRRRHIDQVPFWTAKYFGFDAARATRRRRADRARLCVALPPPPGRSPDRRGGRDDGYLRARSTLRPALDRPVHPHSGRAALRLLRARGLRLAPAPAGARAAAMARRRRLHRCVVRRFPALARLHAGGPGHRIHRGRQALRRPPRGRPLANRPAGVRRNASRSRPPTTDRSPISAGGSTGPRTRSAQWSTAPARSGGYSWSRAIRRSRGASTGRTSPWVTPPAGYRTLYENRSWRVYALPACSGPATSSAPDLKESRLSLLRIR